MRPVTFIVGTGRSGSSAISRILNRHPDILSLNEMLASLTPVALPGHPLDGEEFWKILSEPNAVFDRMIRSGAPLPEFLYPRSPGRYAAEREGIPALSLMVLPHLTDDPDGLLDLLAAQVRRWPRRPVAGQYAALFDTLCARLGRRVVAERSGYSVDWIPRLREVFGEARFVHLFRDGPDCAVSMSRHPGYRMIYFLRRMAELSGVEGIGDLTEEHVAALPPELSGLLADTFDRGLLMDRDVPVAEFGALWSVLVDRAVRELRAVPGPRRMSLSYEAVLADPDRRLARLARFTGARPDPDWLAASAASIDTGRRGAAAALPPAERVALEEACAPGRRALAAGGYGT